jgi:enoyl-CoA hydratase/carnithine racemase
VRTIKRTLRAGMLRGLDECVADEFEAQAACWRDPDCEEGVRAFVEKRAPRFGESPREPAGDAATVFE